MQLRVEFDPTTVFAMCDALKPPGVHNVAALALNDTIRNAETTTVRLLKPLLAGLPAKEIRDALRIEPARPDHLEAVLVTSGKAIRMIEFNPQASRASGVQVNIGGKVETYRRAFIATVKNQHRGVFERKGRARLPIRELYGPSIPGMFLRTDVVPKVMATLSEMLLVNLSREVQRSIQQSGR